MSSESFTAAQPGVAQTTERIDPNVTYDIRFVEALEEAGLLGDLSRETRLALLESPYAEGVSREVRQLDLLNLYYEADGDVKTATKRVMADAFLIHHESHGTSAKQLLSRFSKRDPALQHVTLERIGGEQDGPVVLRAGDDFVAVEDEPDDGVPHVYVRDLVAALNAMRGKLGGRERWVMIRSDEKREAFVSVDLSAAMTLCRAGFLEEEDPESLIERCGW